MWPRRSQALANAADSAPPRAVRPVATEAPAPTGSKRNGGDDCGWLLRAVANKKKKKQTKAPLVSPPPASTTVRSTATAVTAPAAIGWTGRSAGSAGSVGSAKVSKKRPLECKQATAKPKASSAKLPRGVGWSQPSKSVAKPVSTNSTASSSANVPTAPPGESFEDVFAEIYGSSKRPKTTTTLATLDDDDTPSLPLSSSLFLSDHSHDDSSARRLDAGTVPKPVLTASASRAASRSVAPSDREKWDFAAPSAIRLDAFDAATGADSTGTGDHLKQRLDDATFCRWKDEHSSHAVSDNFVRLNMRKRFKGSSGKAKKQPAYLRSRGFIDADEKALIQQKADSKADVARPGGGGGLLDDGIDFIEECLEMLKKHEALAQVPSTPGEIAALGDTTKPDEIEPPRCQHAVVCQRVLVKKKNKNHGRAFFSCPLGYDEGRCDYFLWEENHTQFALHRLFGEPRAADDAADDSIPEDDATANYIPLDLSTPIAKQANAMLTNLRVVFGHSEFRAGQQWAIERVFQKKQTLLVLPTGAGKSLCYQYPALFLPGITIVISPLISLMNDQFHNLPPVLKRQATCVTTSSSSKTQYAEFVRDLLGGKLRLLFVSPEKALTSGFQRLLTQMQSRISLVCVDEAHCISEWSHHFRPSYLRLASIFALADSVLAITATASRRVERDILSQLTNLVDEDGGVGESDDDQPHKSVLRMPWQRENLHLRVVQVATDEERLERLCDVLTKTAVSGAIIMYVHQQWQAEAMANLLQERLALDGGGGSGSKSKWAKHKIAAYHAKMDPEVKEKVRLGFLSGRVKLVIATIAFGMGIDKQNVRLVIHYHVPSSIEHYLQQVGRAGRDGRPASALLFLLDDDVRAFRSLLFSNALHLSQLRKLMELVTRAYSDETNQDFQRQNMAMVPLSADRLARRSRVWMHVASLEQHLDMKSAMIETFLTLLSLHPSIQTCMRLTIQPTAMSWCVISMMETQLKSPQADPLLKRLVASVMNNDATSSRGHVEIEVDGYLRHLRVYFHVASAARELLPVGEAMDVDSRTVDIQSRRLMQSVRTWQASGLIRKFQMERSAFDIEIEWLEPRANEADERAHRKCCVEMWTNLLYERHNALEAMEIKRLRHLYVALRAAATPLSSPVSTLQCGSDSEGEENDVRADDGSGVLERKLSSYFDEVQTTDKDDGDDEEEEEAQWRALTSSLTPDLVDAIERDIEVLTSRPPDAVIEASLDEGDNLASRASRSPSAFFVAWHGHNVARVFHGLASPCFPSKQWRDQLWWRKYNHVAFEKLVTIADKVLASTAADDA